MHIQYQDFNFRQDRLDLIDQCNEIISEYQADGYSLTLRQIYYQLVSRNIIPNTKPSYDRLGSLMTDARMAGLVSWLAIEDRNRGIRPWLIEEDETSVLSGIEHGLALDYWKRQGVYCEVWVEKDALTSVIQRPCERWRVPYMPCKGYLSASEAWRSGRRFKRKAAEGFDRLVLIHLGDHDPSGIDMTRDNSSRLELFGEGLGVEVMRIALNRDQVDEFNAVPNPAKVTDSRAEDYIARFGPISWELDAIEPRSLDNLLDGKIKSLVDIDLWGSTEREEDERREVLSSLYDRFEDVKEFLQDGYGI